MATATMLRFSCRNVSNKLLLLRGFHSFPKTVSRLALPSSSTVALKKENVHTNNKLSANKELFELPLNPGQGSNHWLVERAVAVGLLAAIPAGVFYPTPIVDHALSILLPLHAYWGVNAIISDYLYRPLVPVTKFLWGGTCILSTAGLIYLNVNDVGVSKFVGMIMSL